MIYKIEFCGWRDALEIGDVDKDVNGNDIKVLSIIKIESYDGDTVITVQGVDIKDLN